MLYEYQGIKYEKDLCSVSSPFVSPSELQTKYSLLNSSETLSGLDFVKSVHPGTIRGDLNLNQLSPDESELILKAEREEQEYHREGQMTTLINSRYDRVQIILNIDGENKTFLITLYLGIKTYF